MRRRRTLTPEEEALWGEVARTTARLKTQTALPPATDASMGAPILAVEDGDAPFLAASSSADRSPRSFRILKPEGGTGPLVSTPAPYVPPASGLDKRTETRLRKGKRDPENARLLDTLYDAYDAGTATDAPVRASRYRAATPSVSE